MKWSLIRLAIVFLLVPSSYAFLSLDSERESCQVPGDQDTKPVYTVDVIVTNVDVVVTDKAGKRVMGLKPENFRVYEDGNLQKLTNFYELEGIEFRNYAHNNNEERLSSAEIPSPKIPPRAKSKVIFYFDNWQLHPLNRNWSIGKIESFIQNNIGKNGNIQGLVAVLDQRIEIIQDFTSDAGKLIQAVDAIKKRTGQGLSQLREREEMRQELNRISSESRKADRWESYERAFEYARSYVESTQHDLLHPLGGLEAFLDYLGGIEGRKYLIYVSDSLSINPAEEVFGFIDQAFPMGTARTEAMKYDITRNFKELTAKCCSDEITLYPINAQGLEGAMQTADQQSGWKTYDRGSGMSKVDSRIRDEAMKILANDTGGVAIINTNDIEAGLDEVANDFQFYYSLGYKSPSWEEKKYHSIRVELSGVEEDYKVRVRQGNMRISPQERIKGIVFSRLFLPRQDNPMEIKVQMLPPERLLPSDKLRLNMKLLVPIRNLSLVSHGDSYTGKIRIYFALEEKGGEISPCYVLEHEVKIPFKDFEEAVKRDYPYYVEMDIVPTQYSISVALEDASSTITSYLQLTWKPSGEGMD